MMNEMTGIAQQLLLLRFEHVYYTSKSLLRG
jgi:hypothetical protein